jgi:hypothetical protein
MPHFGHVFAPFPIEEQRMATSETVSYSVTPYRRRNRVPLRISAIAGSAGLAGGLFYWHVGAEIWGQPAWLFASLLYATSIGLTAALIFRFFPNLGPFMELTSVSRLMLASASVVSPKIAIALLASPALNATIVVLGAVLIRATTGALWPAQTQSVLQIRSKQPAQIPGGM